MELILNKLFKEDFISVNKSRDKSSFDTYLITWEGRFFIETQSGYEQQMKTQANIEQTIALQNQRMERNEERLVDWTRYLTFGTIAIVVWEIIKYLSEHFHWW